MNPVRNLKSSIQEAPEAVVTLGLLAVAAVAVVLALWPGHPLVKAAALAWLVLP